jgi:hypothetical protein
MFYLLPLGTEFRQGKLLTEMLRLETLLTVKVEKALICLVGTRRPTVSIIDQQLISFLKTLIGINNNRNNTF